MGKTAAQLDREIAKALARPKSLRVAFRKSRRGHATVAWEPRDESGDAWDVARDAILEHDTKRAADIWRSIRKEYGVEATRPPSFDKALAEVPADVRQRFEDAIGVQTAAKHVKAILDAIYRSKDPDALLTAVSAATKHVTAMKRVARKFGGVSRLLDSSGAFDPQMSDLNNMLVGAKEMVRRIKIQRKTGRLPKATSRTAWRTRGM